MADNDKINIIRIERQRVVAKATRRLKSVKLLKNFL